MGKTTKIWYLALFVLWLLLSKFNFWKEDWGLVWNDIRPFSNISEFAKILRVKVVSVVQLKLAFMEWFFYDLVTLIKLHKIRYLDKARLSPRNCGYLSEKLKTSASSNYFNIFCWNFARFSYLKMSTKGCSGLFYFV